MTCASLSATIPIKSGNNHFGIAADNNNNRIFVGNYESSSVSIIDVTREILIDTVTIQNVPNRVYGVAFNSGNDNIYVASSDSVGIISGTQVVHTIPNVPGATAIAINPDNKKIYVTNQSHAVTLIDGGRNEVVGSIQVGDGPTAIAFNSFNKKVYVANSGTGPGGGNTVSVIDSTVDNPTSTPIRVGDTPEGLCVSPNGDVYVTNAREGTVSVINWKDNSVSNTISLWDMIGQSAPKPSPQGITSHPNGNFYIANEASGSAAGSLSVIESSTNRVLAAIPIPGYFLRAVAVANEKVYVTGANNVFVVKVV